MPSRPTVPARVAWAIELLALGPSDRVLEIGCGNGLAAGLIADQLQGGSVLALDRSSTAIERARTRNEAHLRHGRVRLARTTLAALEEPGPFDRALAVNVNLFWTAPADEELAVLRRVLAPDGALHLVYESPGAVRRDALDAAARHLAAAGFEARIAEGPTPSLAAVTGRPGP